MSGHRRWISPMSGAVLALGLWVATVSASAPSAAADPWMAQGGAAFQRGQFEQAALAWQQASDRYANEGKPAQQLEVLIQLAEAYQALGQPRNALAALEPARRLAEQTDDQARLAAVLGGLGNTYGLMGASDTARSYLERSIALARQAGDTRSAAQSLNNLGNLLASQGNYSAARTHYEESLALAREHRDQALLARVLTNRAKAALEGKDPRRVEPLLNEALQATRALGDSHDKAYGLIALGQLYRTLPAAQDRSRALSYQVFSEAAALADTLNDPRSLAYAWGYLGQLYQAEHRYPEAVQLTRRAVFAAQQAQAPELSYRWQWQLGRLLVIQDDREGAILAYRQAVASLQAIRQDLSLSSLSRGLSFREAVGNAFFELADLLLQRASQANDPPQQARYLVEARDTVEQLKAAEITDYFQDDCVVALQSRITRLDEPSPRTAVLYPILLPDRTVLLVNLPDGIKQLTVPIGREALTQVVGEFRRFLEKRTTREYLPAAQRLYGWLITPLEADLQNHQIDTLIIVPDGALRTIPLTALHDGRQFLLERYAVATTPGLALTI